MKTILRGTILKRYLSIPTLIAKVVCEFIIIIEIHVMYIYILRT